MPGPQGAGAFGAGAGSAGFDPVSDPSESTVSSPPAAIYFDPATRDFRMGTDGRFVAVDPIDQEVVFALWLKKGTVGSTPEAGSSLRSLKRQGGPGFVGTVDDIIRRALSGLTSRNAITIKKIEIDAKMRGRTYVMVTYQKTNSTALVTTTTSV
jgi:hypothetical protein